MARDFQPISGMEKPRDFAGIATFHAPCPM